MSIQHVVTRQVSTGGETIGGRISISSGSVVDLDEVVPGPSTNLLIALTVDVSQIQSVIISCDKNINLFFNDPSTGTPDKTINLLADKPFQWDNLGYITNPFSVDIDSLYVTKSGSGDARLRASFLVDPTV